MAEQNQMEMEEFEFPDEEEFEGGEDSGDEEEYEVEDDTPEEDRGREPLPEDVVEELESDELNDYSERVRTRMSQLKKVWHDERRAKEATQREREEALRLAQQVLDENKRLRSTLSSGEEVLMQSMREAAEREMEVAKRQYKEAYDAGETDRVIEAQERLTAAQYKLHQALGYRPQFVQRQVNQNAGQEPETRVNNLEQRPQVPKPDRKAVAWQERNEWFGTDEEMTSLALGLHEKLVNSGIDPRSDEYYGRIDATMRKRFPEYFGGTQEQARAPRARATVVAPASRSTAPKKVVLTKTQVSIAKKLGVTPEQYARELMKERQNG